jgi:hypothetical protein
MAGSGSRAILLLLLALFATDAASAISAMAGAATSASDVPDFSSDGAAWIKQDIDFQAPPSGGPGPVTYDPAHPFRLQGVDAQGREINMTQRVADLSNPILRPWVAETLRRVNARALADETPFTAMSACWPAGVPNILMLVEPMFFIQAPNEVLIVHQRDHQVRRVRLNAPHSKFVPPSWYGESVGRYDEDDTLVVDTVGLSNRTFIDSYGTPHSDRLHVVERYQLLDGGKRLQVLITVDDPVSFTTKWSATVNYARTQGELAESVCAENNMDHFRRRMFPIPTAARPDF